MDKASKILRESLSVLAIFVSPIGMMYWSRECQQFVNILTEVCQAQPINFSICAPNLPVVKDELRPVALSYHAYLATVSRVVQATEPRGNAQLTLDGCFDNRENRIWPEATMSEREDVCQYNWLACAAPMRGELTSIMDQISQWPVNREVEETTLQEIINLPLGLRYILSREANVLKRTAQARELTYIRELPKSVPALATIFGWGLKLPYMGWVGKSAEVDWIGWWQNDGRGSAGSSPSGSNKFYGRPSGYPDWQDCSLQSDRLLCVSDLVVAQEVMKSLISSGKVLYIRDQPDYTEPLGRLRASPQYWFYSFVLSVALQVPTVSICTYLHVPPILRDTSRWIGTQSRSVICLFHEMVSQRKLVETVYAWTV